MDQPPVLKAALRRAPPEAGQVVQLSLAITDPEVVAELLQRDPGDPRDEYARTALRIGVLAMRQAGGVLDAATMRREGELLVKEVEKRLQGHAQTLDQRLEAELKAYLHPESGHFQQRIKELVAPDGKLAGLLRSQVEGDTSAMARQLAASVGENSPLMKHLDPKNKEGIVEVIAQIAEQRLEAQTQKVLGEFDPKNPKGVLTHLKNEIESRLNPNDPSSALGAVKVALEKTQAQIKADLTLDSDSSALSTLHNSLRKQIDELLLRQTKFQQEVGEVLSGLRAAKAERAVSPSGGFDFEHAAGEALRRRAQALGDAFESVGETTGLVARSKVGDHVQAMNAESAAAGEKIVFECKRADYSMSEALAELDVARRNRGAAVGVLVLAASSVRDNPRMGVEFSQVLARHGNDVVVVWDEANPATDVVLDAAVTLARAIAVRESAGAGESGDIDWDNIDKALNDVQRQIDYFAEMSGWCSNIKRDAGKIEDRLAKVEEALKKDISRLNDELDGMRR